MTRDASFPPSVGPGTRVLLLGSLPGQVSLAQRQYYAHPRNQFWQLVGRVIGQDLAGLDYGVRLAALVGAGIGLWDVVGSATRQGSGDSAIRDHRPNDLAALAARLPALAAVGFNGGKAYKIGAKALAGTELPLLRLPSSSPAYAAMRFEAKLEIWLDLRLYLPPAAGALDPRPQS